MNVIPLGFNIALWAQQTLLEGDFFAQNTDVVQPGEIAPFYARAGHTLDTVDVDGDGENDMMIMLGGFTPSPSNDIWITEDGNNWVFCGYAPWSPRAWHATTTFQGTLWLMGGTPLNNEVWKLEAVRRVQRVHSPLTRSLYNNYTFELDWTRMPDAPWSPRVGMSVVSQWFYDTSKGEVFANTTERIVLVGGYGGFLEDGPDKVKYDGFSCRSDSWTTINGFNWTLLNAKNSFPARAWAAMITYRGEDPRLWIKGHIDLPRVPRIYIFGGGFVGFSTTSKKRVNTMDAYSDAYWSEDGITWQQMNYQEGGGSAFIEFYSSELWSKTLVNSQTTYLGLWGATVNSFNASSGDEFPGDLILIGGDFDGAGGFSSSVFQSLPGMFCNVAGVQCSGNGQCQGNGKCLCDEGFDGLSCEQDNRVISAAISFIRLPIVSLFVTLMVTLMTSFFMS